MSNRMFVVITYNQAGSGPELDYPDLHWGPGALDRARDERDAKTALTASYGRRDTHVIAEVTEIEDDTDAS